MNGPTIMPALKVTGGSPGLGKVLTSNADGDATWQTPGAVNGNIELAYGEISSVVSLATTMADIPGLSITFATTTRPAIVEAYLATLHGTGGDGAFQFQVIRTSDNAVMIDGIAGVFSGIDNWPAPYLKFRVAAGTASTTYKVQATRIGGAATGQLCYTSKPVYIQAVQV